MYIYKHTGIYYLCSSQAMVETPFEWNILDRKETTKIIFQSVPILKSMNRSEQHDTYFLEDKLWFQIISKT